MKILAFSVVALSACLLACSGESVEDSNALNSNNSSNSQLEALSIAHKTEDLNLCLPPPGITLNDIQGVVEWINAMPKPLTLACFIASLPRPLTYNATVSILSAQPSLGAINPRIFINRDKLWMSFVPQEALSLQEDSVTGIETSTWDADNIQLLELSYEVESNRLLQQSIKGELAFPVLTSISNSAPFTKVAMNEAKTSSICGGCHGSETIVDMIDETPVFRSVMLRNISSSEVSHASLINQYLSCNPANNTSSSQENNEWYRCQMYEAFFSKGDMLWSSFAEEISTL